MTLKNRQRLSRLEVVTEQLRDEPQDSAQDSLDKAMMLRMAAYSEPHPLRRRGLLDCANGHERRALRERFET